MREMLNAKQRRNQKRRYATRMFHFRTLKQWSDAIAQAVDIAAKFIPAIPAVLVRVAAFPSCVPRQDAMTFISTTPCFYNLPQTVRVDYLRFTLPPDPFAEYIALTRCQGDAMTFHRPLIAAEVVDA